MRPWTVHGLPAKVTPARRTPRFHWRWGGNCLAAEAINRHLTEFKAELAGEHPTAIERLLIDVIGTSWLAHQHAEDQAASVRGANLNQAAFVTKRAEITQKRLLGAVRTLTILRASVPRGLAPLEVRLFDGGKKTG